jgi:diguanylate cyclase (GGDEF)-like protein/PAS domain S-box-containing protein
VKKLDVGVASLIGGIRPPPTPTSNPYHVKSQVEYIQMQFSPILLPLLFAAVISALLAVVVWRRRSSSETITFAFLMAGVAEWSLAYALELAGTTEGVKVLGARLQYFGIGSVVAMWLLFALAYANLERWLTFRNAALLSIEPIIMILLVWTNDVHRLIWQSARFVRVDAPLYYTYGTGFWVNAAYSYLIFLLSTFLLIRTLFRSAPIHRQQVISLLIGALAPWLGNVLYLGGLSPIANLDLTPFGFTISGLAIGWGLLNYRLFDIIPVARNLLIDSMGDGVLVLDIHHKVVDVNPAAAAILGATPSKLIGQPAHEVCHPWLELVERYAQSGEGHEEICLHIPPEGTDDKGDTLRYFDVGISPLDNRQGHDIGRLLTFRDISEQKRVEVSLLESESRFRRLTEATLEGVVFHEQGKIIDGNPALARMFGYEDVSEIVGKDLLEFVAPEARKLVLDRIQADGAAPYEAVGLRKDGTAFPVEASGRTYELQEREIRVAVIRDITEHRQAQRELCLRQRYLELLNEITLAAMRAIDSRAMVQLLADRVGELLDADGCYITQWVEREQRAIPAAAYGPLRESYRDIRLDAGEKTTTQFALEAGCTLVIEDVCNSPYVSPCIAAQFPTRSMLVLPLIVEEQKLGAVLVAFNTKHRFSQVEIAHGEQAAGLIALALAKSRLLEDERRRAQELGMLFEVSSSFATASLEPQEIAQVITRQFVRRMGLPECSISLYDSRKNELLTIADDYILDGTEYVDEEWIGRIVEVSDFPATARVLKTMEPLIVCSGDQDADPAELSFMQKYETTTLAVLPLVSKGRPIGIIEFETRDEERSFTQEEINLAMTLANQAAVALENAQLFAQVQELAITDGLTGLYNRRHFSALGRREFNRANRFNHPLSAIMLDIDDFKKVNDTYGHPVGDQVLHAVANGCIRHLRDIDIVGRYGGDEFTVLLPETESAPACEVAERLRRWIASGPIVTTPRPIGITTSFGVAEVTKEIRGLDNLLENADIALYKAKESGKNRVARG